VAHSKVEILLMFCKPYIMGFGDKFCSSTDQNVRDFNVATKSCMRHWSFLYYDRLIGEITNMETIPAGFIGDWR
jgi:hypothetical protein